MDAVAIDINQTLGILFWDQKSGFDDCDDDCTDYDDINIVEVEFKGFFYKLHLPKLHPVSPIYTEIVILILQI